MQAPLPQYNLICCISAGKSAFMYSGFALILQHISGVGIPGKQRFGRALRGLPFCFRLMSHG